MNLRFRAKALRPEQSSELSDRSALTFGRRSALNQRFQTLSRIKSRILKWLIDDTEKNPFDTGAENPGYDETGEINEMDRFPSSSSRRGSEDINNPYHHRTYEETSFTTGGDERTPLLDEVSQENRQKAVKILKSKFPKWNPLDSSFNADLNQRGEVVVMVTDTRKAVPHVIIDADGNVNEREIKKSKKIQNSLGPPAEDIIRTKEEEISRRKNYKLLKQLLKTKRRKLMLIPKNNKTKFQDLKPKLNVLRSE